MMLYKHIGVPSSGHQAVDRLTLVNKEVEAGWEVINTIAIGMNARDYTVIYVMKREDDREQPKETLEVDMSAM